jgi:hypothetical protein
VQEGIDIRVINSFSTLHASFSNAIVVAFLPQGYGKVPHSV